jgi:two-component system, NarL family, nitrate/nitrite response regulator NarL
MDHAILPEGLPSEPTRVYILSDVRLYREGLLLALVHPSLEVVAARAADDAAMANIAQVRPDIVLADAAAVQHHRVVARCRAAAGDVKVLAFGVGEDGDVVACAEAGAAGYVSREASLQDLVRTIEGLKRGELHQSPSVAALLFRRIGSLAADETPRARARLTGREREVMELLGQGLSNKEIGRRLGIRLPTVKNHVHNILEKLQVGRRGQAVARAYGPRAANRPGEFDAQPR